MAVHKILLLWSLIYRRLYILEMMLGAMLGALLEAVLAILLRAARGAAWGCLGQSSNELLVQIQINSFVLGCPYLCLRK